MVGTVTSSVGSRLNDGMAALVAMLLAFFGRARRTGEIATGINTQSIDADGTMATARQTGTVITVVVLGVVSLVGILIFAEVADALPSNHSLSAAQTDVTSGFESAMGFIPIILLVLLAAVVISVVSGLRG
jgi:uncharacterized membrane protein YjgN (DUF898 family)